MSINDCVAMTMFLCLVCFSIEQKCKVSQMNVFLRFTQKFKMAAQNDLGGKMPVHSVDTLGVVY